MPKKQPSSIDKLPEDIRDRFYEMLNDPRMTGLSITDAINDLLASDGHPERVSKSSVYRKRASMERIGQRLKESREVAKVWVGKLGAEPQGQVGKLLNEMVRNLAFEVTMQMADDAEKIEPKMLKDLAIAIDKLEKATSENVKREEEVRKQERERLQKKTMDAVESAENSGPMTTEMLKEKIREVYGV